VKPAGGKSRSRSLRRPSGSPWIVLAESADPVGAWLRDGFVSRGLPAELVTAAELFGAPLWRHEIPTAGAPARLHIALADGRRLEGERIAGVVNRLSGVPSVVLDRGEPEDRIFADQEWKALVCSSLYGLAARGVPVIEPPDPYILSGRWRSPAAWVVLASRAGFAVPAWRWTGLLPDAVDTPDSESSLRLLVVGNTVTEADGQGGAAAPVSQAMLEACGRLAVEADRTLLAVTALDGEPPIFLSADPLPDPREWGDAIFDALTTLVRR
jgi:hypothetical protein